ncbi:hypothetical protein OGAPHI_003104 [Ogataea philodendri]|uniref:UDP-N-acetylglucosamine transferase subunit ALG13 n=1 Tax=Ogataea philodendri TaxID=1378263 RepID=A0A9P8P920_9ASCO|nr:uncharacterized protein OGAPHI_003104 [Ogataea philodendri]KAH3667455.1 hypothetical protein OGAPHI_003104 [Ogataea philodendri]
MGGQVLVTCGATVCFDRLVENALDKRFFGLLLRLGFDRLVVQYGKTAEGQELVTRLTQQYTVSDGQFTVDGLHVELLAFDADIVANYTQKSDLVISHGGTGSVLDSLRCNKKLVVVINSALADNHQEEIAEAFAQQGLLEYVRGDLSELLRVTERVCNRSYNKMPSPKGRIVEDVLWS